MACTKPALLVLEVFASRTRHNPKWAYYELATGHDAMLSAILLNQISQH
jgi:hypothetical protein